MRRFTTLLVCWMVLAFSGWFGAAAQDIQTLTYGTAVSGTLTSDVSGLSYNFAGKSGDSIYISMYAPNRDLVTQVQLLGPGAKLLGRETDNGLAGTLLGPFTLPDNGTYTIIATRPDDSIGDYRLLVDRATISEFSLGQEVSGTLPLGGFNFYSFSGKAQDLVRYNLTGSNMGIVFIPPGDGTPMYDGMYDNPSSMFNILPTTGTYLVTVQTLNPDGVDYTLRIAPVELHPIKPGEPLTGKIGEIDPIVFSFESAARKIWALNATVTGGENGTRLAIYNGNTPTYAIAGDGTSGPGGFPRVDPFIAPETATYYVALTFDNNQEGDATSDYQITLNASTLLSLAPGKAIEGKVTADTGSAVYVYNGKQDEHIRITITRTGDTGTAELGVRLPDQNIMYLTNYGAVRSASFELVLPLDGLYLFEIRNSDSQSPELDFSILLEQVK